MINKKNIDSKLANLIFFSYRFTIFWIIAGSPVVIFWVIKNWIKRDKKWCISQGIGFRRIWNNEWNLYLDLLKNGEKEKGYK